MTRDGGLDNVDVTYGELASHVTRHELSVDGPLRENTCARPRIPPIRRLADRDRLAHLPRRPARRRPGLTWTDAADDQVFATPAGRVASAAGTGPPLLCDSGWVTHLRLELDLFSFRPFMERRAERFTVIRYDKPGCGLSDRRQRTCRSRRRWRRHSPWPTRSAPTGSRCSARRRAARSPRRSRPAPRAGRGAGAVRHVRQRRGPGAGRGQELHRGPGQGAWASGPG